MNKTSCIKSFEKNVLTKFFSGNAMDWRQIVRIIIPIFIDQFFITAIGLVNTSMISSSGMAAISAVNMVDSLNTFLVQVFIAISIGGTVVVAQYKGSENDEGVSKAASGSITAVFLMSFLIAAILIIFHMPILRLLFGGAEADVFANAKIYIIGSAISYIGIAVSEAVCGALRGIGETKSSLLISVLINSTYVLLNFLLINIMHMGILGMSISIISARFIGAAFSIFYIIKHRELLNFHFSNLFKVKLSMIKRIAYVGIPFAAEQMFFNGGKILTQTFVVGFGTGALAVNAISSSICGLMQIHANTLCIAIVTVVGQCVGRKDIKDARKFIKSFIVLSSIGFILSALIVLPLFRPIVSLFNPPDNLIPQIFNILLCVAIFQVPVWSTSFVIPSALRAAGDSKFTSLVSMLSMWLFRVVLGYIIGVVLKMGVFGIWLAMDCEWGVRSIIFFIRLKGKKWYAHHLID